jgi:hypothetical protein
MRLLNDPHVLSDGLGHSPGGGHRLRGALPPDTVDLLEPCRPGVEHRADVGETGLLQPGGRQARHDLLEPLDRHLGEPLAQDLGVQCAVRVTHRLAARSSLAYALAARDCREAALGAITAGVGAAVRR